MKIKIVSDLHTENLTDFDFIEEGDFDVLFIAGDISTRAEVEYQFLKKIKKPVYAVAGNHLGYKFDSLAFFNSLLDNKPYINLSSFNKNYTHTEQIKELLFNTQYIPNVNYLHNSYTKLGNYVVYGGVMYTNFELFGKKYKNDCMKESNYFINDFKKLYKFSKVRCTKITPKDYRTYFKQFIKGLEKCLEETTEDIIVLTHFCPSANSINKEYYNEGDLVNSCFASNLDSFILDNPRIKLWVHGHTHIPCNYKIGECSVVCNPFGYIGENYREYKDYKEVIIEV